MFEKIISSKTMNLLTMGLDAASMRQRVIADNLANIETPGYKRSEVVFESELRKAMGQQGGLGAAMTHERHIPFGRQGIARVRPEVVRGSDLSMRVDGNNVDIDREMAELAKNSIKYEMIVQQLSGQIKTIKSAIEGRI